MSKKVQALTSKNIKIEGDIKDVVPLLKSMGEMALVKDLSPCYYSESKDDYLMIYDMATPHIKNAIKKKITSLFTELSGDSLLEDTELLSFLIGFLEILKDNSNSFKDNTLIDLLEELYKRYEDAEELRMLKRR